MPEPGDASFDLEHFPFLARLEALPEWEAAAQLFLDYGGPVMVLGAPDTGKSTLSRYLVYKNFAGGQAGALVDLDLGQSHLGPPATLGLGLYPPRMPGDDSLFPEGLYFVGQTSPVGSILEVTVGCRALADQAAWAGINRLVVNTSGLVQGPGALRLKKFQVELLQPSLILALQRDRELEPLLRGLGGINLSPPDNLQVSHLPPLKKENGGKGENFPGWRVLRLPVSSRVSRKTPEDRRRYREERFRRYFQKAGRLGLPCRSLVWEGLTWGRGEPLNPRELQQCRHLLGVPVLYGESAGVRKTLLVKEAPRENPPLAPDESLHWLTWESLHLRLVGLLDQARRTLALGLILPSDWRPEHLLLWTPLAPDAAHRVHFLKVGKMRLSLTGKELVQV